MIGKCRRSVAINKPLVLCLSLVLLSGWSCDRKQNSLIDLVPANSCAVVVIDWQVVRVDGDLRRLLNGNKLESILPQLALESVSVKSIAIFSGINTGPEAGMILRAVFDKRRQVSALKTLGWQEEFGDGRLLLVKGQHSIALPQQNTMYVGTREGARAVFQALDERRQSFSSSSSYKRLLEGMSSRGNPITAFLVFPQGTLDMADAALQATSFALLLFDLGAVGALLKQVNVARGLGLSLGRRSNQVYPVEMCALMRDEKAAAVVSGSLNLMKGFSSMATTNSRESHTLETLSELSVTRHGEVVSIQFKVPPAALVDNAGR